jgi:hypothetical protein
MKAKFRRVKVKRSESGRTWDVWVHGTLIEGGFFTHAAAVACAEYWQQFYMGEA